MTAAIEVDHVTYNAREHFFVRSQTILQDVHFTVPQGALCGFVGSNGAGKTTTLQLLLGQVRPQQGRVRLFGQDVNLSAARANMGFLPERTPKPSTLTAFEWVCAFGELRGVPRRRVADHAEQALQDVNLEAHLHRPLRNFSKGMLQRVSLAQAIVGNPRLLLLDEPLSGLDPLGRHLVRKLLAKLAKEGCTVFFSTHIIADVELLCSQVVVLGAGRVIFSGAPSELTVNTHSHAHGEGIEVVGENVQPSSCQWAQSIGANCATYGNKQRFIVPSLQHANTLAQSIVSGGGILHRLAPYGQSPLEALLVAPSPSPGAYP